MRRFQDPAEVIRSPWIRPEDLEFYEELGIDRFKLSGRTNTTGWITDTARAYVARKSPANFARLLTMPQALGPLAGAPVKGAPKAEWTIDNRQLDGFLDGFRSRDCSRLSCEACGYCARVAAGAVNIDKTLAREAAAACQKALSEFNG
jgi:collagenase-like PrtC family protease